MKDRGASPPVSSGTRLGRTSLSVALLSSALPLEVRSGYRCQNACTTFRTEHSSPTNIASLLRDSILFVPVFIFYTGPTDADRLPSLRNCIRTTSDQTSDFAVGLSGSALYHLSYNPNKNIAQVWIWNGAIFESGVATSCVRPEASQMPLWAGVTRAGLFPSTFRLTKLPQYSCSAGAHLNAHHSVLHSGRVTGVQ